MLRSAVLLKMGLFTLAMVVFPIGSYFVSRDYYFHGQYQSMYQPYHAVQDDFNLVVVSELDHFHTWQII